MAFRSIKAIQSRCTRPWRSSRWLARLRMAFVLLTSGEIGIFSPETGAFSAFQPATKEDRDAIEGMRFQDRTYTDPGKVRVYATEGRVTIESNAQSRDIPAGPDHLGQPSVSHDRQRLAYVRSPSEPQPQVRERLRT